MQSVFQPLNLPVSQNKTISEAVLAHWREEAQRLAIAAEISPAEVDWLLPEVAIALDLLSLRLGSHPQRQVKLKLTLAELTQLWQRRLQERVPLQYLLGVTHWRDLTLKVTPSVLVPRPETEQLIDLAIALSTPELKRGHWVDLGTGSGAIACGLAKEMSEATIHAIDKSADALAVAKDNASRLDLLGRIQFYCGSWFAPVAGFSLSGMVSNPPYIPTGELVSLQPEVAQYEPQQALDGGSDGLESIRYLVAAAPRYLRSQGIWLIEMMAGQAEAVVELLVREGCYRDIQVFRDLAGIDRFAFARRE